MDNLPPLLKEFIRAVTPDPAKGPLQELHDRYDERHEEEVRKLKGVMPIGYQKGTPEYNVEMRIREWVMRMERERAEIERTRRNNGVAPPQNKPPKP